MLTGTTIGFGIGYAVPVLLHYSRGARQIAIGPDSTCGGTCVGISGTF